MAEVAELERKQNAELETIRNSYESKIKDLRSTVEELAQREAEGVQKVSLLESELLRQLEANKHDNQALLLAQKDLETTRHQYKELQSQADDLRRQLTDASLRLQNAKSKEADLLSRISRLSSDLQAARKDGSETAEELAKRESKLVELEAELTATKDSVVILQQEDDSLQSTLVARESELSTLKSQLENAIAKVHVQRMAEVAELERKQNAELETIRNSYESKIKDLRSTVEELAQREAEGVQKVSLLESELLRQLEANKHDNQALLLAQKDLETTRHQYKELQSQADDLRRQLTDASLRLQNAKSKEADLLSRISRLSGDLQAARKDGSETAEELAKRESKLVELEAELTATKDSVVILQQEDDSLQSTLVARESELSTLKSQLENAIARVAELERKQNAELETIRNSYESKIKDLRSTVEELAQREAEGVQKVSLLESELLRQLEANKHDNQALLLAQKDLETTRHQYKELQSQADDLRRQLTDASLRLQNAKSKEADLLSRISRLSGDLQAARKDGSETAEELAKRESKLVELEAELTATKDSVVILQQEDDSLQSTLVARESELSTLKSQLENAIARVNEQRLAEVAELERKQNAELETIRNSYESKIKDLRSTVEELAQREAEGVQKVSLLDLKPDDLRRQLTDASLRLQNAKSKEADLLSRISRLSSDLQAARKDGSETAEELAKRESKLVELEAELTATKDSVVILQQEDDSLQSTLVARESELSTLKSQLENAIARVNEQRLAEVAELERKQNAELETIRNSYESKIKDLRSTVEELAQREAEGVQKVSLLESELLRQLEANKHDNQALLLAQKDLETTRHQYKELQSQADDLRRQLTDASLRLQNAKSKEADLLSRISRLSSDLQAARKDGSETAEELAKRESKTCRIRS
ncbi:hypothetical protein RCL1_001459 [Eukaryota sp. TZLM3-RCL]